MSPAIDHERCSELLGPLVRGQLDPSERALASEHLDACPACREEKAALETLMAVEVPPLTDDERAGLRKALEQELERAAPRSQGAAPARERGIRGRWRSFARPRLRTLAPAFGGALLLLAILYGATQIGLDRREAPPEASSEAPGEASTNGNRRSADAQAASPESAGRALDEPASLPTPEFNPTARPLTTGDLQRLGRSGDVFVAFARSYSVEDVPRLRRRFTLELARAAAAVEGDPGLEAEERARQVRRCARNVMAPRPAIVPAYASFARFGGRPALVMGFVGSTRLSEGLDRYLIWVWPRVACERPIAREQGQIRR